MDNKESLVTYLFYMILTVHATPVSYSESDMMLYSL
jgi:hypothetical protein